MIKLTLEVKGMSCKHCENRVNTAVGSLDGVKKVTANAKKNSVLVQFDDEIITIDTIKQTIIDEGYEV